MGTRKLWQWGVLVGGIALSWVNPEKAHAQADTLSPQELVTRCFQSLADIRLPFNDVRRAGINTQAKALELCDLLIDSPNLNLQNGGIQSANSRIRLQEAKDLVRRFHQYHETFFKSDKFQHVFNEFGYTKMLHDTGAPAAYFTLATFGPGSDYSRAVTESSALQVIRAGSSTSPYGNLLRDPNGNAQSLTRYIGSEVYGTDRGLFSGIRLISNPSSFVASGGVPPTSEQASNFDSWAFRPSQAVSQGWTPLWKNSLGGGFMGDPSFLLLNSGMPIDQVSNGSMTLPRRWSREVMNTALCRNGPYLKSTAPTLQLAPAGDVSNHPQRPPFRGLPGCMQCHSTMDPLAIGIKNLRVLEFSERLPAAPANSVIAPETTVFYPVMFRVQSNQVVSSSPSLPNSFVWPAPASGTANFHRSRVHGRFTYTSAWDGNQVSQTFDANPQQSDQLASLGSLLRNSQDYYLCGTIRYFEMLSGVKIPLESESLPDLSPSTPAYEKKIWADLRPVAQQFLSHKNSKTLLKQLLRTPQFLSRSWGRKVPSNWVRVSSILPKSGSAAGNTPVVISGANFGSGTSVRIGGVPCSITSMNGQEIQCLTGPRESGTFSVDVQKGNQLDVLPNAFDYVPAISYTSIKNNIFVPKCMGCHANTHPNLTNHSVLINPVNGLVNTANPAQSGLYLRVSGNSVGTQMPMGAPALSQQEMNSILSWIQSGAPNN